LTILLFSLIYDTYSLPFVFLLRLLPPRCISTFYIRFFDLVAVTHRLISTLHADCMHAEKAFCRRSDPLEQTLYCPSWIPFLALLVSSSLLTSVAILESYPGA
jgi:hypothetical protein